MALPRTEQTHVRVLGGHYEILKHWSKEILRMKHACSSALVAGANFRIPPGSLATHHKRGAPEPVRPRTSPVADARLRRAARTRRANGTVERTFARSRHPFLESGSAAANASLDAELKGAAGSRSFDGHARSPAAPAPPYSQPGARLATPRHSPRRRQHNVFKGEGGSRMLSPAPWSSRTLPRIAGRQHRRASPYLTIHLLRRSCAPGGMLIKEGAVT